MAYWERIRQSKLNLSYQWRRYYFQNPYASSPSFTAAHAKSSLSSTASHGRSCLSRKPFWVIQNSYRPSDYCNNMRLFGGPAQVSSVHSLLILWGSIILLFWEFIDLLLGVRRNPFASVSNLDVSGFFIKRFKSKFVQFSCGRLQVRVCDCFRRMGLWIIVVLVFSISSQKKWKAKLPGILVCFFAFL